jgi:hypothetical protein
MEPRWAFGRGADATMRAADAQPILAEVSVRARSVLPELLSAVGGADHDQKCGAGDTPRQNARPSQRIYVLATANWLIIIRHYDQDRWNAVAPIKDNGLRRHDLCAVFARLGHGVAQQGDDSVSAGACATTRVDIADAAGGVSQTLPANLPV